MVFLGDGIFVGTLATQVEEPEVNSKTQLTQS